MTEKDNEKLSLNEMEEMAGGGIGSFFSDENATYVEKTCKFCGTVNQYRTDLAFAGIRVCRKCRMQIF